MSAGPTWHPKSGTKTVLAPMCACEYGPCGHCAEGKHESCLEISDPAEAAGKAALPLTTYIIDRRGYVPYLPSGQVATVYLEHAGAHAWRCSCARDGHPGLEQPTLDLFGPP